MFTKREQEIFLRGIAVAFEAVNKWENGLEEYDRPIPSKKTYKKKGIKAAKRVGVTRVDWKEEDDQFIRDNYQELSDLEMADRLNRSRLAVSQRRSKLGLKKPVWAKLKHEENGLARLGQDTGKEE